MAFLIYKKTDAGTNIRYERIKPLKLGGSDGLIARHVKSLPADQTASWKLDAAGLLRLAGVAGENGEHFKTGAMRPSFEFPTPVRFAFPDTSERRSPGVGY